MLWKLFAHKPILIGRDVLADQKKKKRGRKYIKSAEWAERNRSAGIIWGHYSLGWSEKTKNSDFFFG